MSNAPIFTAHDGRVFYRDTYRAPDECVRLLAALRRQGAAGDWFAPHARAFADELEAAMQATGQQPPQYSEKAA